MKLATGSSTAIMRPFPPRLAFPGLGSSSGGEFIRRADGRLSSAGAPKLSLSGLRLLLAPSPPQSPLSAEPSRAPSDSRSRFHRPHLGDTLSRQPPPNRPNPSHPPPNPLPALRLPPPSNSPPPTPDSRRRTRASGAGGREAGTQRPAVPSRPSPPAVGVIDQLDHLRRLVVGKTSLQLARCTDVSRSPDLRWMIEGRRPAHARSHSKTREHSAAPPRSPG